MELAVPLIALGGLYVASNQEKKKEGYENMGKPMNSLPNYNVLVCRNLHLNILKILIQINIEIPILLQIDFSNHLCIKNSKMDLTNLEMFQKQMILKV